MLSHKEYFKKDAINNEYAFSVKTMFEKYPHIKGVTLHPRCNSITAKIMYKGKCKCKSFNIKAEGSLKRAFEKAVKQRMQWEQELYDEIKEDTNC
jgi:hypothetical protein